ncbi:CHAT domain-containing protein [Streptomyces sp. 1222.5]|uniref:CHAT domain-containing protein n=1 Tax=Streptomyces sp. 1222.5 TaxID=1881026 RepID=UPI003D711065
MEDLERYLHTGDGRDLPSLAPATLPPPPGADAADTARLALLRWYRYLHLPGVNGLLEFRAAVQLAGVLDRVPEDLPPLPDALRENPRKADAARRGRRWPRRGGRETADGEREPIALGPARVDQLQFLMGRFEEQRDFSALDTALDLQRRWLKEKGLSARERAALLTDHAHLLLLLGDLGAHRSWRAEAERAARLAVETTARQEVRHDPHLANRLLIKARCATARYDPETDPTGLERAVQDLRRAVEAAGRCTPPALHHARDLVTTLTARHEATGAPQTLTEALTAARDLVRATHPDDRRGPEHREWLAQLEARAVPRLGAETVAAVLGEPAVPYAPGTEERHRAWWATAEDADAPWTERRKAALALVSAVPGHDEDRPGALLLAAQTEMHVWLEGGDGATPDQARVWAVQAADAVPPGHRLAGRALTVLAEATLYLAAEASPRPDERLVEEALADARRARSALLADAPDTPLLLERLAVLTVRVANVLSDGTLLAESVDIRRQSLALTPDDEPFRPFRTSNLAGALSELAHYAEDRELAEEALALAHEAADALPEDHPRKHELLLNLADHYTLGEGQDAVGRLTEAERLYRDGLARLPADHPDLPRFTSSISQVLYRRYQETGDRPTLEDAVGLARDAAARTADGDWFRTTRLLLFARAATALYDLTASDPRPDTALRAEALTAWDEVAQDERFTTSLRFEAQEKRAALARAAGDPERALRALEAALAEVPALARRSFAAPVRKGIARRAPELAVQAAIAAIEAGRPGHAVELLEKGRAILYGQAIMSWRHRAELRRIDTAAAERLETIDRHLATADFFANVGRIEVNAVTQHRFGRTTTDSTHSWDPRSDYAAQTRRLAAERDRIVEALSADPRFAELTGSRPLAALRAATAGAAVAYVLTHGSQGYALLVPADPAEPVEHIPLPGLTGTAARAHIAQLRTALRDAVDSTAGPDRREAAQSELHDILGWLWDEVTSPVLARLGTAPPGRPKPRLWWCPVGPVVRLPLHAAGHHPRTAAEAAARAQDPAAEPPPTVIDRVTPSYTPTLGALAHSLRDVSGTPAGGQRPSSLVVAVPHSRHGPPLPLAEREARTVLAALPGARLLLGEEADLATVKAALRDHTLVHFACHGDNDIDLGLLRGGGLHLGRGETLTAGQIQDTPLDHGALAILSACSTAEAHPGLPDEPMHLAAAFQLAGFRAVVGTLWHAPDTPGMARELYAVLTADGTALPDTTASAQALNHAQRTVRDAYPATPTRWAAYLHTGA